MPVTTHRAPLYLCAVCIALSWAAKAETVTVSGPYPVAEAAIKLEDVYGWAITFEDPPLVYAGDLWDATSVSRKDGKRAGEPGVLQVLAPRPGTFSFSFDPPLHREPGARAPEGLARGAILDMLKAYSLSIGDVEAFTLTDSNGLFHITPTQRKGASGAWEKIVPLLDAKVTIPPGRRTGEELLNEICHSLASQSGVRVDLFVAGAINLLSHSSTQIASRPDETARSILSRFFAELAAPRPVTFHFGYMPSWGYGLFVRVVDNSSAH